MTELEKIKHLEYYFPIIFANLEVRDFGVMFYNTANPNSHDSNHAVIINDCDYEKALEEIKEFYNGKNLEPRVYSSLEEGQLQIIRPHLERANFKVNDYGYTEYLVYNGKSMITEPHTLDFRRFNDGDDLSVFTRLFEDEDTIFRTQEVVRRRASSPDYYLYIGYADDVPVVMASFQFDENMSARLDEVETAEVRRGKVYARQITRYLTDVFEKQVGKLFFTWVANDTA
jgi:hypothetical protein